MASPKEVIEYRVEKYAEEVFQTVADICGTLGAEPVPGMDEALRLDGRVFALRMVVEEYAPREALRDLSAEVVRGAEQDPDARLLAASLRRAGYEGRLRNPRRYLHYVEAALTGIEALDLGEECPAATSVALPYLLRRREELLRVIEAFEAEGIA